jgi:hypothetical protein
MRVGTAKTRLIEKAVRRFQLQAQTMPEAE